MAPDPAGFLVRKNVVFRLCTRIPIQVSRVMHVWHCAFECTAQRFNRVFEPRFRFTILAPVLLAHGPQEVNTKCYRHEYLVPQNFRSLKPIP